jgi:hypothetical protein
MNWLCHEGRAKGRPPTQTTVPLRFGGGFERRFRGRMLISLKIERRSCVCSQLYRQRATHSRSHASYSRRRRQRSSPLHFQMEIHSPEPVPGRSLVRAGCALGCRLAPQVVSDVPPASGPPLSGVLPSPDVTTSGAQPHHKSCLKWQGTGRGFATAGRGRRDGGAARLEGAVGLFKTDRGTRLMATCLGGTRPSGWSRSARL